MRIPAAAIASLVAFVLIHASLPAQAQSSGRPTDVDRDGAVGKAEKKQAREDRFSAADTNKDGGLSREEARKAGGFSNIEKNFDAMDANRDGKVTPEERRAYNKSTRAGRKSGT